MTAYLHYFDLETTRFLMVVILLVLMSYLDITSNIVSNGIMITALLISFFMMMTMDNANYTHYVFGLLCGLGLGILPFVFGLMGGADVKAYAVVGSYIGMSYVISTFVYSLVFGCLLALYYLFINKTQLKHFSSEHSYLYEHNHQVEHEEQDKQTKAIAFIPCILAGVILTYFYPLEWTL